MSEDYSIFPISKKEASLLDSTGGWESGYGWSTEFDWWPLGEDTKRADDPDVRLRLICEVEQIRAAMVERDIRDFFAGQALPEAVNDYGRNNEHPHKKGDRLLPHECSALGSREDIIARQAFRYADAMLKARESKP